MKPKFHASRPGSGLERKFELCWRAVQGPELIRELKFDALRKWRFDFAHLPTMTAIEVEGGHWKQGRHNRGGGFEADMEKYNAAAIQGWRVFRLTARMITVPWCECLRDHIEDRSSSAECGVRSAECLPAPRASVDPMTTNAQRFLTTCGSQRLGAPQPRTGSGAEKRMVENHQRQSGYQAPPQKI